MPNFMQTTPITSQMMTREPTHMPMVDRKERSCLKRLRSVTPMDGSTSLMISAAELVGVPAAPNGTGVELNMRHARAAAIGGAPRPITSGAQMAAGVPKPAAPSMKAAKAKPTITSWMRASSVMPLNMASMRRMAPASFSMFIRRIAPKMISNVSMEPRKPVMV